MRTYIQIAIANLKNKKVCGCVVSWINCIQLNDNISVLLVYIKISSI